MESIIYQTFIYAGFEGSYPTCYNIMSNTGSAKDSNSRRGTDIWRRKTESKDVVSVVTWNQYYSMEYTLLLIAL